MQKTFLTALIMSFAVACAHGSANTSQGSAYGSEELSSSAERLDAYDTDDDDAFSKSEFDSVVDDSGYFASWDSDGNGELIDLEYQTGMFNAWDTNGDEVVDTYEFRDADDVWLTDYDAEFVDWDADGDAELTLYEFQDAFGQYNIYSDWDLDGDGELVDHEYTTALFNAWDTDGDERVDYYEYRW